MLAPFVAPRPTRFVGALILVVALVAVALFLRGSPARAALGQVITTGGSPIYGTCTGQKSGVIKGDSTRVGHVGQWTVSALTDGLTSPRDPSTGLATGAVLHTPIKVTMAAGPQTVRLISSLSTNEVLTTCQFDFYRPSSTGVWQNYLRIQLTNAGLGSYALSANTAPPAQTTFTFVYQRITWTWLQGGISATDTWGGPA